MDDTKRIISKQILVDTANAIRSKKETSDTITPSDFANEIASIETQKPTQSKTVAPSTSQQTIEPDEGYELSSVTVSAVTSSIDSNIRPQNIKENVSILGVTGTLSPVEFSVHSISKTLPQRRNNAAVAVLNGIAYIFGGKDESDNDTDTIYKYDIAANTISTSSTTLPFATSDIAAVTVLNAIYLFCGNGSNNKIYVFFASNDTIVEHQRSLSEIIAKPYAVVVNGFIYLAMFKTNNTASNTIHIIGVGESEAGEYKITVSYTNTSTKMYVVDNNIYLYVPSSVGQSYVYKLTYSFVSGGISYTTEQKNTSLKYFTNAKPLDIGMGYMLLLGGYDMSAADYDQQDCNRVTLFSPQFNFNVRTFTIPNWFNENAFVVVGHWIYGFGSAAYNSSGQKIVTNKEIIRVYIGFKE